MVTIAIMVLGIGIGRIFPAAHKGKNERLQLVCTLLLIFSMGVTLGGRDGFFSELLFLGARSFLFFVFPTAFSIAAVYLLTRRFMGQGDQKKVSRGIPEDTSDTPKRSDPMVLMALGALILGIIGGAFPAVSRILSPLTAYSQWILYLLMFSVGISVGLHKGILVEIRRHHIKILVIPLGIIIGSLAGGLLCGLIMHYPLNQAISVAGGLGWYSLSGVAIGNFAGVKLGSIAFLSNLIREIGAFFMIPFLSRHFNSYTCIAPAAATSEDTTLTMIIRHTNEETVVFSVLNGILCSAFVPVLISLCY